MTYVKSCGFIAYRQIEGENLYLIIKSLNGDFGFPKIYTMHGGNPPYRGILQPLYFTQKAFVSQLHYIINNIKDKRFNLEKNIINGS